MKYLRVNIVSCILLLLAAHALDAASHLRATIPANALFKNGEISWNFGQVAQGVTPSSFFDLKNASLIPLGFTITLIKEFDVTPSTGALAPNQTVRIKLQIKPSAISGSPAGGLFTINATQGDPIINWTVATIVDRKPDLSATFTVRPLVTLQNAVRVPISLSVKNTVNLVPSQPCEVKIFLDNAPVRTVNIGQILPGGSANLDGGFETNKHGTHTIRVVVDSNNQNNELNETNNEPPPQNVNLP